MNTNESMLTETGNTQPNCPHCGAALPAFPARKTKCAKCGRFFLVRTRPLDRKKVLVSEHDAITIEKQWNLVSGIHDGLIYDQKEIEKTRKFLSKNLGYVPDDFDIKKTICTAKQREHASNYDWGLYRNIRFQLSEFDRAKGLIASAFSLLLEVCYLDLNGPNNCGAFRDDETMLKESPPFRPDPENRAPRIIELTCLLAEALELHTNEIEKEFISIARNSQLEINTPLGPENAWIQLRPAIEKGIQNRSST